MSIARLLDQHGLRGALFGPGQREFHDGSAAPPAANQDVSAMRPHDRATDGEPEADASIAFGRLTSAIKLLEYLFAFCLRNPRTIIGELDRDGRRSLARADVQSG